MNKAFEMAVRMKYGDYCRGAVKRMFEVWCECKGVAA